MEEKIEKLSASRLEDWLNSTDLYTSSYTMADLKPLILEFLQGLREATNMSAPPAKAIKGLEAFGNPDYVRGFNDCRDAVLSVINVAKERRDDA
jgi:hypothetical protein